MKNNMHPLAVSNETGYSLKESSLACAWVEYYRKPDDAALERRLVTILDLVLNQTLPERKYFGLLHGRKAEIRQEALLCLLQRYLVGNQRLLETTLSGDLKAIANQLRRSIHAAVWVSVRKLHREIRKERNRFVRYDTVDESAFATTSHPAEYKTLWALPFEAQQALVLLTLRKGIAEHRLPAKSAHMALDMVEGPMSSAQMARTLGVTRQAVHQRLKPVRNYLRKSIDTEEFV